MHFSLVQSAGECLAGKFGVKDLGLAVASFKAFTQNWALIVFVIHPQPARLYFDQREANRQGQRVA